MQYFSKDENVPLKRIRFVRIHGKDFLLVRKKALCCARFLTILLFDVVQSEIS